MRRCVRSDIGTQASNLANFVTGQRPTHIATDLASCFAERAADDNAHILTRFAGGPRGMIWASQVAVGNANNLSLRIYDDRGGLEWCQEAPHRMKFTRFGDAKQILSRSGAGLGEAAGAATPLPSVIRRGTSKASLRSPVKLLISSHGTNTSGSLLPGISAGLDGMRFISAVIALAQGGTAWISL